ncbi:ATP-binding response regulator [Chondrinema litorale]|uniref:ATP-binding response regulator n=1 Tax=Chondrinema litorale TaxID=2994555 RepID=UPI0025437B4F|nr:response regulator [Chondrinema litorale]UZR94640.1 response regulator [Chondrinema litorale]
MPYTILLADDDQTSLQTNLKFLKELGKDYVIVGAPDGVIAYELILRKRPDLIIIDWMMPRMTGLQVLEKVKNNPEVKDIPIIMVTAMVDSYDLAKAFKTGVTDYVKKPVDKIELLSRARAALKSYSYFQTVVKQKKELAQINDELKVAHQKLSSLNDIKNIFFAVLSNDINEPLNSLKAFVRLLFKNINNFSKEEMKYVADNIKASLNDVSSLLKSLVKWSERDISNNEKELNIKPLKIKKVLSKQISLIEEDLTRKQILTENNLSDDFVIHSDKALMCDFFSLFIECCARFIIKKGTITFSQSTENNLEINIEGFRIMPKLLESLFSLDFYLTNQINPYERGSGLGFVLCQNMLQELNFYIRTQKNGEENITFIVETERKLSLEEH